MDVIVHDNSGHPFTGQLARALAAKGHSVLYLSFGGFQTPKGKTTRRLGDPELFRAEEITISAVFDKDNLIKRRAQLIEYGRKVSAIIRSERPDVVISGNAGPEVASAIFRACTDVKAGHVFWVQDIYSEAVSRIFAKKSKLLAHLAGSYYRRIERRLINQSDGVVVISDAFLRVFEKAPWSVDISSIHVIENWGIVADVPLFPRDNPWVADNMRDSGRPRIVYSGTLARKHNPDLILALARNFDADVYLFSEGSAPEALKLKAREQGIDNLFVRPWVPVEELPLMLAGADIFFAVIEPDAGVFSVPSKVLSYLAAGRPILASIPGNNLAAQTIEGASAGLTSEPNNEDALLSNAARLLGDGKLREEMGRRGRAYAERAFDIDAISSKFENILRSAARSS